MYQAKLAEAQECGVTKRPPEQSKPSQSVQAGDAGLGLPEDAPTSPQRASTLIPGAHSEAQGPPPVGE